MFKKTLYMSAFALLTLQGCSALMDGHLVAVDSYAPLQNVSGTYFLTSAGNESGFNGQAFETSLQDMLATKGYTRTFIDNKADYRIVYNYTASGPYTTEESFPAAVNYWWGVQQTYPGVEGGMYNAAWYASSDIQYENYFVKKLDLAAYTQTNKMVWKVVGTVQSETMNQNIGYEYLISGVADYIDITSGKVAYVNVVKDSKTGEYRATKW